MKIVAGLGNPGAHYANTRHNAGWMALDRLAYLCEARAQNYPGNGALARSGGVVLFKPPGYMNRSGPPIARLLREREVGPPDLLVVLDDLNLPLGTIRLRAGGSSGGHRGLASVIHALGTREFARLRIGVGPCPAGVEMTDFVLGPFLDEERDRIERATARAAEAARCWAEEGIEAAMNRFNGEVENRGGSC